MASDAPSRPRARPLAHVAQGLMMGGADVVPGVSGGTVALIVGIYERLIASIRAAASVPVALARGDLDRTRRCARDIEWGFVLPLGAGIAAAIGIGSFVIPPLIERYPEQMLAVFFGLVAASVPIPWRRIRVRAGVQVVVAAVAALVAFFLVGMPPQTIADPGPAVAFAAASIAICAMILPGVSGAFLLAVMGVYEPTLAALRTGDIGYVAAFGAGAALGLGVFAKVLGWLLERRHDVTMAALVGLMIGALRALWPWQTAERSLLAPSAEATTAATVALGLIGFAGVLLLLRLGRRAGPVGSAQPENPGRSNN